MSARAMSETLSSTLVLLQSIDDRIKSSFDAAQAKTDDVYENMTGIRADIAGIRADIAGVNMTGIRADIADVRKELRAMNKKLDDILHIVRWDLPHC